MPSSSRTRDRHPLNLETQLTPLEFARRARKLYGSRDAVLPVSVWPRVYAIPQLSAVIVPINYRLSADHFVYVTVHSIMPQQANSTDQEGGLRRFRGLSCLGLPY